MVRFIRVSSGSSDLHFRWRPEYFFDYHSGLDLNLISHLLTFQNILYLFLLLIQASTLCAVFTQADIYTTAVVGFLLRPQATNPAPSVVSFLDWVREQFGYGIVPNELQRLQNCRFADSGIIDSTTCLVVSDIFYCTIFGYYY